MKMEELHLAVLEMMERVRDRHSAVYYGTRRRNAPTGADRINQGCVFLGNERYVFVPLCPVSGFPNPTTTVGVVLGVEEGSFVDSWIEIVVPVIGGKNKSACAEDNAVYERLATKLKSNVKSDKAEPTKHYIRKKFFIVKDGERCADVISATEKFLDAHIEQVIATLRERNVGEKRPLVYDQVEMVRSIDRFLAHFSRNGVIRANLENVRALVKGLSK